LHVVKACRGSNAFASARQQSACIVWTFVELDLALNDRLDGLRTGAFAPKSARVTKRADRTPIAQPPYPPDLEENQKTLSGDDIVSIAAASPYIPAICTSTSRPEPSKPPGCGSSPSQSPAFTVFSLPGVDVVRAPM
jgi:hypothetical protein